MITWNYAVYSGIKNYNSEKLYANLNANISTNAYGDRSTTFTNYTVDCERRFIIQADTPKKQE